MPENTITIPEKYVEVCRAIGKIAKEAGLHDLQVTFRPGFSDSLHWSEQIQMSWVSGRHFADINKVNITSTQRLQTTVTTE